MSNIFCSGGHVATIYPTPESMQDKINEYFELCFAMKYNKTLDREVQVVVREPTYSGLAMYLGFSSRRELLEYAGKRDQAFSEVLSAGLLRIEDHLEGSLRNSKAPTGIMFSLKNNAGWEDKTKQQLTGDDDKPLVFGWSANAGDVIDAPLVENKKEGVLPAPTPQIESTCVTDGGSDW